MDIRVDGSRSSSEFWSYAHHLPSEELPQLNADERQMAGKLGLSPEEFARQAVAVDLTREQLAERARVVGALVQEWLVKHAVVLAVDAVWLKTFEGKYRIDLNSSGRRKLIFLDEDIVDDLLEGGQSEAQNRFDRVLTSNFAGYERAKAS